MATNQNWSHSGAALIGYDSRGDERVLEVLPLQQTKVVASRVAGSAVMALTESGLFLKFQCKLPSMKQNTFDLALESKSVLGSASMRFTSDSVVLSKDGSVAFVSNLGGIRALAAGGETVERVENEVVVRVQVEE